MGHTPADGSGVPSAPPLQGPAGVYPRIPDGNPGAPVMHPAQQQQQYEQPQQQQYQQIPQHPQQQPPAALMHPSALPALRPPPIHVVEQHAYVQLPAQDEPLITRSTVARHRQITCPACFRSGPTVVTRQPGCCAYLACFGLCWVCCPLFWLPFCLDCDKDVVHRCGACGTEVARVAPCS